MLCLIRGPPSLQLRYCFVPVYCSANQNSTQEEIKCRLEVGNSCYYSVQTLLSSRLHSKIWKIKIYKTIILPVVLCGCETWFLTLRDESRLRVFENRILRRIFGPKRDANGEWRRLHNEKLRSLYPAMVPPASYLNV